METARMQAFRDLLVGVAQRFQSGEEAMDRYERRIDRRDHCAGEQMSFPRVDVLSKF